MESKKRKVEDLESSSSNNNEPPTKKVQQQQPVITYREPSILNIRPLDDITKYIADLIATHCQQENVEIEAKLGRFIDKATKERLNMGAITETIIPSDQMRFYRFESNMPLEQHRHFNKMLNDMVTRTQAREYKGERIKYKHTIETDRFYEMPRSKGKWRVTTDQATGQIIPNGIIEKKRIVDLNIHAPNQPLDYRISINIEIPRTKPTTKPVYERNKDRISYQHGGIAFDLTQVKGGTNDPEIRHELELEFADAKILAAEKRKHDKKEPSQYTHMIEIFVNNIRILSRNALKL
ncbi:CYTH-like domain-containing protein [Cokeromyces recurvatus]|uniref:CYTH-like domain-containing protein n=1 Tax=Cokeromyces recurvatus TaxID=90255 RepID=UPI002220D4E1|nr:CYTH-like domain-containing protein [Cokeromyces recurvatus]KAI7904262.1 CYTH-like domain-containing protein [Cokeromyces recurvatus]